MNIDNKTFDRLIHDPIKLASEFKRWEKEAKYHIDVLANHLEKGNRFIQKIALYRQNLLDGVVMGKTEAQKARNELDE